METLLVFCLAAQLGSGPPQPTAAPPFSVERIKKVLEQHPRVKLDVPVPVPVATFKSRVEKTWVPTLEEVLRKEFTLTALQRQSAEWGAKCCGVNLGDVFGAVKKARQRGEVRRVREQIKRELADIEARRK